MRPPRVRAAAALAAAIVLVVTGPAATQERPDPAAVVRAFVAAFNARSIDDMLKLAADDVEWLSVNGGTISIVTAGKQALQISMMAYFKSCATCRSEIEISGSTATRVAAVETASWQGKSGSQSQRSLSVYELEAGLIRRVYYYPVER